MKTNWKNKLKAALEKDEFLEVSTKTQLTKTDKTTSDGVLSVFVSGGLGHILKKKRCVGKLKSRNIDRTVKLDVFGRVRRSVN